MSKMQSFKIKLKMLLITVGNEDNDSNAWRKVTLQADKDMDYLTLKKVMYSIYEAGGGPINFAVAKEAEQKNATQETKTQ